MHIQYFRHRARLVTLLTVAALTLAAFIAPDQKTFYLNAAPLSGGSPGDIVIARESVFTLDPMFRTPVPGVASWRILYKSENATGETIDVSGTLLVPTSPWHAGERPIIGYAVGTRGNGDACAPSNTLTQGLDYEGPNIAAILAKGWAVAVTDYEGLGTPGVHTYMVGPSQGRATLNMVRAAQRLPEAGLSAQAPVGIMGYSQGGGAAGWAAELAGSYAPELNIVGVAAGGVPANLVATGEFLEGTMYIPFTFLAAVGLDAAYEELHLSDYLNARGKALQASAPELCMLSIQGVGILTDAAYTSFDDYTTSNPLYTTAWQTRLAEQALGHVVPEMPVFLYHGKVDQIVPFEQAVQLRQDWCGQGATVDWSSLYGEHVFIMMLGAPLAIDWLSERISGLPTLGNCGASEG